MLESPLLSEQKTQTGISLTRNYVARIHRILVFDEAEAIHQLDLSDLSRAMGIKMGFHIGFGSYSCVSGDCDGISNDNVLAHRRWR